MTFAAGPRSHGAGLIDSCVTCTYSQHGVSGELRCHRNPPVMNKYERSKWPVVDRSDWCGQYAVAFEKRIAENKRLADLREIELKTAYKIAERYQEQAATNTVDVASARANHSDPDT